MFSGLVVITTLFYMKYAHAHIAFLARIISLLVCIIHYVECEDDWGLLIWKEY